MYPYQNSALVVGCNSEWHLEMNVLYTKEFVIYVRKKEYPYIHPKLPSLFTVILVGGVINGTL
jgi:hypothetical protein